MGRVPGIIRWQGNISFIRHVAFFSDNNEGGVSPIYFLLEVGSQLKKNETFEFEKEKKKQKL